MIISIRPVLNKNTKSILSDEKLTEKLAEQYGEKSVFIRGASIT